LLSAKLRQFIGKIAASAASRFKGIWVTCVIFFAQSVKSVGATLKKWLSLQELAKIVYRDPDLSQAIPERTLRHLALQKKIKSKKIGRAWVIDPQSVVDAGFYIPEDFFKPKPSAQPQVTSKSQRKYPNIKSLGVYNELCSLYQAHQKQMKEEVRVSITKSLYHLAFGFYDYPKQRKAEQFKLARRFLVESLVTDDLSFVESNPWRTQIEEAIIPGVIGLIRKQEVLKKRPPVDGLDVSR
jgi:hypothetical protein